MENTIKGDMSKYCLQSSINENKNLLYNINVTDRSVQWFMFSVQGGGVRKDAIPLQINFAVLHPPK